MRYDRLIQRLKGKCKPADADAVEALAWKLYHIHHPDGHSGIGINDSRREARYILSNYEKREGEMVFEKWESGDYRNVAPDGDSLTAYSCPKCKKAFYQRKAGKEWIAKDWPLPKFCPHCGAKAVEKKANLADWPVGSYQESDREWDLTTIFVKPVWDGKERRVEERRQGMEVLYPMHPETFRFPPGDWKPNKRTGKDRRKHNPNQVCYMKQNFCPDCGARASNSFSGGERRKGVKQFADGKEILYLRSLEPGQVIAVDGKPQNYEFQYDRRRW